MSPTVGSIVVVFDAYLNFCCEFKSRSKRGGQHYVIKFVIPGFLRVLRLPPPIKLTATIFK